MELSTLDLVIIFSFFAITLLIGVIVAKKAGKNSSEFFLSGRNMPWWLLGVSMVATTFAADTPNLVAGIVRKDGIAGNWVWWAFLLTGMVTVFIYAKLWRKLGISTDLEYYEIRYKGKAAAFLRGFRAIYLGVFFNIVIMATVCLAGVKIGQVMLGLTAVETLGIASVVTVLYSLLGGLKGVILTDFFQFIIAMIGSIWAAYFIIGMPEIGSMQELVSHSSVLPKLDFIPDRETNYDLWIGLLVIPLAVQWWSVWYPGAEPGGGGYIAQRMLAAKDEKHATAATLFFNFAHYALRPWPWIIIALASLIVFPMHMDLAESEAAIIKIDPTSEQFLADRTTTEGFEFFQENSELQVIGLQEVLATVEDPYKKQALELQIERIQLINTFVNQNKDDLQAQSLVFLYNETNSGANIGSYKNASDLESLVALQLYNPSIPVNQIQHDLSYPSMISFLPAGLLGLILASLISAFMSTISTHLNWGSSYVVNDFYKRFLDEDASEKKMVMIGRISTVIMMLLAALLSVVLNEAKEAFDLILQIGAGTGLLFILRWFWKAINPYSEITAMSVSFLVALFFFIMGKTGVASFSGAEQLLWGVGITTVAWVVVTLLTNNDKFFNPEFNKRAFQADGEGGSIVESKFKNMGYKVLSVFLGCIAIYSALFSLGNYLLGSGSQALYFLISFVVCGALIASFWKKLFE